jgi:hypothetical protein
MNAIGFLIRQCYPLLVMWFQQNETIKWGSADKWLVDPNDIALRIGLYGSRSVSGFALYFLVDSCGS